MKKRVLSLFLAITLCLTLTPTGALAAEGQPPEQTVTATQEAETGAGENAPPANPEENPTEDAPAAAEKNTADGETGKQAVQNEPTMEGKNELLALNDAGQNATGGGIYVAPGSPTEGGGGTYIPGEDTRTEIWCVSKPDSIGRSYDGTTDGGTIPIGLTFTDGTNEIKLKEGTGFTAKKTFDSADAGWHTVTVEIALIGEAAVKYKLKAGEETFTIGGNINKAYPDLTVTLSKTACTVGEKLLPLLSVEGAPKDAEVTYYYLAAELKDWAGSSDAEGGTSMPPIDGNTAISEPGTYYVYAKTGKTKNYEENRSATVALTVTEPAAASVTKADGTDGGTYKTLPAALDAAQDGDTVKLLADHTTNWSDVEGGEYATLAVVKKTLTLDLNGMTVDYLTVGDVVPDEAGGIVDSYDGNLTVADSAQGGSCGKIKNLEFVKGSLAIQGGRIGDSDGSNLTCDGNSGTVTISGGTVCNVTVGDGATVTVTGGTGHAGGWYNDGTLNITGGTFGNVDFRNNGGIIAISGGTFGTIKNTNGSSSIPLMPLLADNYAFYQGDNAQNSTEKTLTNVTVRPHTHSFENGKCDCGASYVASVTTSNGVTNNYTSLDDALDAAKDGDTVKLLGDAEITKWRWLTAAITLDLNGKTITTQSNAELYIRAQVIVQDNSTGKNGGMAGTYLLNVQEKGDLIIQSGTFDGKITINDGKLTIEGGIFKQEVDLRGGDSDSVFFSGGTFAKIWYPNSSGSFLDLLADGCAFYDNDGNLVNAAEISGPFLYNVRVQQHTHSFTDGACACGYTCPHTSVNENGVCEICNKQFAASITEGNDVTYYDTFGSALVYAFNNDGCTLKLLADVTGTTVMINNPFIFDLNGHSVDALSVDAKATIKDSGTTKGRIGKVTVSNEKVTDLTLGDLLEEGYGFKHENGIWADDSHKETISGLKVTVEEAPIKSVVLDAIGADKKEVPTTMAYGTTGAVTLEASCWINDMTVPTYTWYKLEGAAATAPMEGVNGVKYKLPADLPAGKHTYLVICTSGGYSKSAEITITVTPISLEGATVTVKDLTYNGQEQFPTVTVKLGDETLSRDNDYTVQVTKQANAGSYKLTIKGGGNYSGEIKDVEWKIEPMKIDSVMVSSDISKTYDGTATVTKTAEEWAKVLTFKTLSASDVVDVPSEAYTISDAYFVEKSGEETIHSPDAGEKYGITFKITLNDDNYVLQTYGEDTPSTSKVITQSGGATFTIKQATVTSPGEITQLVFNDLAKTYTIDLAALLPELSEGCAYGSIQYQGHNYNFTDNAYLDGNDAVSVSKEGVLTLSTVAASTAKVGDQIGTITVPVVTTNYQKFEFTIKVVISARIPLNASGVTVSASDITYGQMLNESKLTATGTMKHPGTGEEVKGTFAWTNPEAKPGAAGDYTASWTFTPAAGYEEYAPAAGTVTIKVNKATPTFTAPTAQENLTYTGQEQALIIAGSVTSGGTMQYSLTENGTYSPDIPTGTDAGAYTVWYRVIGDANHKDTAPASVAVRIGKKPLTIIGVTAASKTYDGTTNADITSVTFDGVTLNRGTDYTVTASFDKASVGNGKSITATVTLIGQAAQNYALEQSSFPTTGNITKAAAPDFTKETALTIVNGHEKTYTVTLPALPTLETPKEYGALTYEIGEIKLNDGYYTSGAKVENGELTLPIQKNDVETTGSVGTVTVVIKSINYGDITLTVKVSAVNQIKPVPDDGTITATSITYGNELSASTITGTMQDPNTRDAVNGTFTWLTPAEKLNAGSHNAKWIFTPDKSYGGKYTTNTGTATVTVNPKAVTVSGITANDKVYDGNTNVVLDYSAVTLGGVLENDTLTVTATGTLESAGVGERKVRISDLTLGGDSAANYVLAESGNQTETTANITAKQITVSITPNGGTYGSVVAAAAELFGAVEGENVPVTLTYTGNGYNDTAVPVNAGSYTVTASIANSNYTLTGNKTAAFVITTKAVTVSGITANGKVYDGNIDAVLDYSKVVLDGILENDTLTVTATGTMESADVGEKKVTISNLTLGGASAANYVLAESGNQTETTATITAKEVTVTITSKGGTYGSVVAAAAKLFGAVEGENVPVTLTYTGNGYNDTAVPVNAGSYTVTASIANSNYTLTGNKTAAFVITTKAVTVSGITANGKVYDGNIDAVLDYSKVVLDGILENDTLTVTATGTMESADVGEKKVTISDLTLGGDSAANYVLAESGNQTETTATITAKEVTVTPDNKSKVYEEKDPKLTYIVSGVLSGETLKGITLARAEGENAGEYAITATADAGANSNYNVTFAKGTFTIEPKSIKGATVVLGKGLIANGAEQTQTVEKVLLDDKEIPAESYTVAGNTATDPGRYTLTVTAKGNYTDFVEQTYAIAPAKAEDAPGEEIAIGSGKVKVVVKSEGAVPPATLLTDKAELLAMLVDSGDITADELAQIADGASVDIALTVKEANVSAKIKTAMAQAAKGCTIGQYLDISLFKYMTVNGSQQAGVALHTTKDALTISVVVPDALINTNSAVNRTYCIVRNHEGTITVLDAAFDAAGKTLTFKTDRFSIYAIAYKDTAVPSSSKPSNNNSSNDSETKKNEVTAPTPAPTPASTSKPSTITAMPQTGDTSNPTLYVVLLVASLLGLAVVFVCKKRNDK